jgi:hypothetical protein
MLAACGTSQAGHQPGTLLGYLGQVAQPGRPVLLGQQVLRRAQRVDAGIVAVRVQEQGAHHVGGGLVEQQAVRVYVFRHGSLSELSALHWAAAHGRTGAAIRSNLRTCRFAGRPGEVFSAGPVKRACPAVNQFACDF